MRSRTAVLAAMLAMAPLGAQAADLVVWWEEGYYAEEDEAVREIIAAFEQETGKQVELVFHPQAGASGQDRGGARGRPAARLRLRLRASPTTSRQWAFDDRLVDLTDAVGHFSDLFDPDALDRVDAAQRERPGRRPCTGCRWAARPTTSTSGRASWSRRASRSTTSRRSGRRSGRSGATRSSRRCARPLGRDDIWGIGLPMSVEAVDTANAVRPVHDCLRGGLRDPRRPARHRRSGGPAQAHQGDRQLHGDLPQGLHPARFGRPGTTAATTRRSSPRAVVMTPNQTLSIPNALKRERPDDYYENTATIEWPLGPTASRFPIEAVVYRCRGLQGRRPRRHRQGVRPLPRGRGLARALSRLLRRAHAAADAEAARAPFWLDPSDPHRMAAVMQVSVAPAASRLRRGLGRLAARPGLAGARLGEGRSTASSPRASAPSRRSTRRSRGSSRS